MPKVKKTNASAAASVSAVYHFCLRWSVVDTTANRAQLIGWLRENADKYIVQAEKTVSDEGKENPHYQGYFHKKVKARPGTLAKSMNEDFLGVNLQAASIAGQDALKKYCMKDDTRINGPWSDKPIYLGKDLWPEANFLPWQKTLLATMRGEIDDRLMYWVYDPVGNNGKTKFAKYLVFKEDAVCLGYSHAADTLNLVSKMPGKRMYLWNLTRSKPAQLSEQDLYSCMESIKDGLFVNTKYETKMVLMNPPHIVVFANHLPKTACISADRWKLFGLDEENKLVDVQEVLANPPQPPMVYPFPSRPPPVDAAPAAPDNGPHAMPPVGELDGIDPDDPLRSEPFLTEAQENEWNNQPTYLDDQVYPDVFNCTQEEYEDSIFADLEAEREQAMEDDDLWGSTL